MEFIHGEVNLHRNHDWRDFGVFLAVDRERWVGRVAADRNYCNSQNRGLFITSTRTHIRTLTALARLQISAHMYV